MTLELKALTNPRLLEAALKDAQPEVIQTIIDCLMQIKDRRAQEIAAAQEEQQQRQQQLNELLSKMNECNISIDDLIAVKTGGRRPRRMAMRYRYIGTDGVEREWSGQGKTPTALRELMERDGTTKEDYLIDKPAPEQN